LFDKIGLWGGTFGPEAGRSAVALQGTTRKVRCEFVFVTAVTNVTTVPPTASARAFG
jgi:hypothetical protein